MIFHDGLSQISQKDVFITDIAHESARSLCVLQFSYQINMPFNNQTF